MIYAAFTLWLFLILFAGSGVYGLWGRMTRPQWVNWALLPGTVVSEMAYIFGCLITGGEIRRAKLMPGGGGKGGDSQPATESTGGLKVIGPIVASLLAIVACGAAVLALASLLGQATIGEFDRLSRDAQLAKDLPRSMDAFWRQLEGQVRLLRRMCETWWSLGWTQWRVPLFVYLAACLSVRIAPVSRPMRPTLAAAVVIALLIALVGLVAKSFANLMSDLWPLLSYIWASLLLLLAVSLLIAGAIRLVGALRGKDASPAKGK